MARREIAKEREDGKSGGRPMRPFRGKGDLVTRGGKPLLAVIALFALAVILGPLGLGLERWQEAAAGPRMAMTGTTTPRTVGGPLRVAWEELADVVYRYHERLIGEKAGFVYSGPGYLPLVVPYRAGDGILRMGGAAARTLVPVVALTIDDGPDPRYTAPILTILRREGVRATFFVIGNNALRYPYLVREELAEGHEVGNHSFSHPDLRNASYEDVKREVILGGDAISRATQGEHTALFRPPSGRFNGELARVAAELNYRVILWTVGLENRATHTPEQMIERVLAQVRPGSIILLHDGRLDRTATVLALGPLIERLKAKGYQFVTISEMLGSK